jgi:hypothetical protein
MSTGRLRISGIRKKYTLFFRLNEGRGFLRFSFFAVPRKGYVQASPADQQQSMQEQYVFPS